MSHILPGLPSARLLGALAFLASVILALPASGGAQCLDVTVEGAPGLRIFADGFEGGDAASWPAPAAPSIAITATTDLKVTLHVDEGLESDHLVELRFETPGGFLYQSLAVPISATGDGAEMAPRERRIPGYPFPVAVKSPGHGARLAAGELAIDVALPVAGTPITQTSLTGEWRVWVYVDAAESACLPPKTFYLEP